MPLDPVELGVLSTGAGYPLAPANHLVPSALHVPRRMKWTSTAVTLLAQVYVQGSRYRVRPPKPIPTPTQGVVSRLSSCDPGRAPAAAARVETEGRVRTRHWTAHLHRRPVRGGPDSGNPGCDAALRRVRPGFLERPPHQGDGPPEHPAPAVMLLLGRAPQAWISHRRLI